MLRPQPPAPGFERPDFAVIQVGVTVMASVPCPGCDVTLSLTTVGEHWKAGHFDRRPLDTSNLPPARRILGRGAGPRD
jgi:hypothetical protein